MKRRLYRGEGAVSLNKAKQYHWLSPFFTVVFWAFLKRAGLPSRQRVTRWWSDERNGRGATEAARKLRDRTRWQSAHVGRPAASQHKEMGHSAQGGSGC